MSFENVSSPNETLRIRCQGSDNLKGSAFSIERLLAPCEKRFEDNQLLNQHHLSILKEKHETTNSVKHCK